MWPEGDAFGSVEVEPEEELELLKQILFTKLPSKLTLHILLYLVPSHTTYYIIFLYPRPLQIRLQYTAISGSIINNTQCSTFLVLFNNNTIRFGRMVYIIKPYSIVVV